MKQINYSPLETKISEPSIMAARGFVPIVVIVSLYFSLLLVMALNEPILLITVPILVGLSVWKSLELHRSAKQQVLIRKSALNEFANINGSIFHENFNSPVPSEEGSIPDLKKRIFFKEIIIGRIDDLEYRLFEHAYYTGSGKSRQKHYVTVASLGLPHEMPQMVIDSLVERSIGHSILPITFKSSQKIELEGDFYKYFSVYAPDKREIDALMLLAPDVMEVMLRNGATCDVEFVGKKMYFYWPMRLQDKSNFEQVFTTIGSLMNEIGHKLKRFNRASVASSTRNVDLHAKPQPRLKIDRWRLVLTVAPILILSQVLPRMNANDSSGLLIMVFYMVIVIGSLIYKAYSSRKKDRLRKELQHRYGPKNV